MSLADVVAMVENWDLRMRMVACAAQEQSGDPVKFIEPQMFRLCSAKGWEKAWAAKHDSNDITDDMIRTAIKALIAGIAEQAVSDDEHREAVERLRRADDEEREFRRHTRMRKWEIDNAPPPPQIVIPPSSEILTPTPGEADVTPDDDADA